MFKKGYFIFIIFLILIIIPFLIINGFFYTRKDEIIIKVYNHKTDKIVSMELSKYLKGVVAAEMPAAYHIEALKAQSIASRTYTLKKLPAFGGSGCNYPGADISTDYRYDQAWYSENEMKEKWGFFPYFYYWARISRAVEETAGKVLVFDHKLIDAVYHSNSGGKTENAGMVWKKNIPYLISVDSPYDKEHKKNYRHVIDYNLEEINNILETGIARNTAGKDTVTITDYTDTGRVLNIKFWEREFTGEEIRERLNLPSAKFTVEVENNSFIFTVFGNGHGVGMSQDGADGFAKNGYNYKQILQHFYNGVEIIDIDSLPR